MRTYAAELHNPPLLRRLAQEHSSMRSIAKMFNVSTQTVRRALIRYEIEPPRCRYATVKSRMLRQRTKRIKDRQKRYHAAYPEGRRRRKTLYVIARHLQAGLTDEEIITQLNLTPQFYKALRASPYITALHWAWGEIRLDGARIQKLARKMAEAGFDGRCILRTLEVNCDSIAEELRIEL